MLSGTSNLKLSDQIIEITLSLDCTRAQKFQNYNGFS